MVALTVSNPKQWVELNSIYPVMKDQLPCFAHQPKPSFIHDQCHLNTSKVPQLQLNLVEDTVSIEDMFNSLDGKVGCADTAGLSIAQGPDDDVPVPAPGQQFARFGAGCFWGVDMNRPPPTDDFSYILQTCRNDKDLAYAKRVHEHICAFGLNTHTMLECHFVPMFVACGSIHEAQHAFDRLIIRDEISWRYLIQGYTSSGESDHAFELFERMQEDCMHPGKYVFIVLLKACARMKSEARGRKIHFEIVKEGYENDTFVTSTLVDTYMKIGSLADAFDVFDGLLVRDVVSWTTLMGGYADQGFCEQALDCYKKMQSEGVPADRVTYICCLKSCSSLGAIERGLAIHSEIIKQGFDTDISVFTALVGMYAKGGWLSEAKELLQGLTVRCVSLWNALIAGYSEHGLGEEALKCLGKMRSDGISPNDITFVCSLKACATVGAVQIGQEIHTQLVKQGFESENFVGSILVDVYSKCGWLKEAHKVFDGMATQDVVSWTTLIAGYVEYGFCDEALSCLEEMQMEGTSPDAFTFVCILNGCASARAVERGLHIHEEIAKRGVEASSRVSSTLIKMYADMGLFTEAEALFDQMPVKDDTSWNGLIGGFVEYGFGEEALVCMDQMQMDGACMKLTTFLNGLKACRSLESAEKGFEIHSQVTKFGMDADPLLGNNLVDVYSKCGCLLEAQEVFDGMQVHNTVAWTALVAGYAEHGHDKEVLDCLEHMRMTGVSQDVVAFICSLKACCCIEALSKGQELHNEVVIEGLEIDPFVGSTIVDMYAKCGSLSEAEEVLHELPVRNVVSWTAVVAAHAEQAHTEDALRCFEQMHSDGVSPNAVTYVSVLKACKIEKLLDQGRRIHSEILKVGVDEGCFVGSTLVDLYATCGILTEAQEVFDKLVTRDLLSWNALLGGYSEHGQGERVLNCLEEMQKEGTNPDDITYIYSLRACYPKGTIDHGQCIYSDVVKKGIDLNPFVSNSVVAMYVKHQAFPEALNVFDELPFRDTVSWSSLVVGYTEQGLGQEALRCFEQMKVEGIIPDVVTWNAVLLGCAEQGESERALMLCGQMLEEGVLPNSATFLSIIKACGNTSSIDLGKKIYAQCCRDGVFEGTEMFMETALVEMFGNCGSMANAQQVFDAMPWRDTTVWNALMRGYSRQGKNEQALHLFENMKKEGAQPDSVTFLCVLMVCNHAGLLDKAQEYFESMSEVYSISASIKHHNCMIDLLGRAGHLNDALIFLKRMPFQPNVAIVNTLLHACQKWGNVQVGKQVFEYAVRLKEKHGGLFVLMSNIYADDIHSRDDSRKVEAARLNLQGPEKPPMSCTEVDRVVQILLPEDFVKFQSQDFAIFREYTSTRLFPEEDRHLDQT